MPGGSELTTDHTCGRHETVEEYGEQPREPRRKCAIREKTQGEKGRNGSKGKQREQKATPCTSSSTFPLQPLQQPQQPQRQCAYNDACDVRRNVDFMDGVNESDDLTQEQPVVQHSNVLSGLKHLGNQEYVV